MMSRPRSSSALTPQLTLLSGATQRSTTQKSPVRGLAIGQVAPIWHPGKGAHGLHPCLPGQFYSSKPRAAIAWWKDPNNSCPSRLQRIIQQGVKVEFINKSAFQPKSKPPKFVEPHDVKFVIQALLTGRKTGAYGDLAAGGEHFLSRSRVTTPLHGKQRIVHALCPLNEATVQRPTKYEGLRDLPSILQPGDWMVSFDVESAFFHIAIEEKHRKYFSSHLAIPAFVKGEFIPLQPGGYWVCKNPRLLPEPSLQTSPRHFDSYFQVLEWSHLALPLGWRSSPRIWGEIMNVVNAALRRVGIRTLLYVDDLLACARSEEEALLARDIISQTLEAAGITRSPTKGQWVPSQTMHDHLGTIISSIGQGSLQLPERRCSHIRRAARHLLHLAATNRRLVCSTVLRKFCGIAVSSLSAIPLAMFHLRSLYSCQERFRPRSFLTQQAIDDLKFWRNMTPGHPDNFNVIWPETATTALSTDASGTTGFGSVLEVPLQARREAGGYWMDFEMQDMIALKELKAAKIGLEENVELLAGQRIRLYQDNTVVVACLKKFSSRSPPLMQILYDLVPWLQLHRISLEVLYIRSEFNLADPASRRRHVDCWSLLPRTQNFLLAQVQEMFSCPVDTDPFACRQSAVAARYCTPLDDHQSSGYNGLLLDWSTPHVLWLNPPWNHMSQVLDKIIQSKARGVLIYPQWPLQPWFARLEACSLKTLVLPSPRLCIRPHHPGKVEPLLHHGLTLKAILFDLS